MGKGDRKTRKGKIWRGSYGKTRPQKSRKKSQVEKDASKSKSSKSAKKK